jgi:rubrerythrin
MMDARTYSHLAEMVRRESRTLLQYVGDSYPWITPDEQNVLAQIRSMIQEERQGVAELMGLILRNRLTPPYIDSYPVAFTSLSFVSLEHLIPLLTANEEKDLIRLERELGELTDSEAKELVKKIVETKNRHLESLRILNAKSPQTAVA